MLFELKEDEGILNSIWNDAGRGFLIWIMRVYWLIIPTLSELLVMEALPRGTYCAVTVNPVFRVSTIEL